MNTQEEIVPSFIPDEDSFSVIMDTQSNFNHPKSRITFSELFNLYREYEQYIKIKNEQPKKYKNGASIRSIANKTRLAKSTVNFYFQKFKINPYCIIGKYFCYREQTLANARKGKPKFYKASLEQELLDWILRKRQEGLTLNGEQIQEKARTMIKCPKTKFSRRWLEKFLERNNLSFRKCTHTGRVQQLSNLRLKIKLLSFTIS